MAVKSNNSKRAVGYIRAAKRGNIADSAVQRELIMRCITASGFSCIGIFEDPVSLKSHSKSSGKVSALAGTVPAKSNRTYSAREEMLSLIVSGEVDIVIVDIKERLYSNTEDKQRVMQVLRTHNIELVEVPPFFPELSNDTKKVCIYHYFVPNTRGKGIRTMNLLSDTGRMYEEVSHRENWLLCGVYLDNSAYRRNGIYKLLNRQDIDVIICKYFYHINRKTLAFIGVVQELTRRGVSIISTEEGILRYKPMEDIQNNNLVKVVTYDCFRSDQERNNRYITTKRFDVFYRTIARNWKEMSRYVDEDISARPTFHELVNTSVDYDIVVVETFGKLGESVNELVRHLNALKKPVYSLKEGLIFIERERDEIQGNIILQGIDSS